MALKMPAIIRSSHVILYGSSAYASGALVKCRKVGAANWATALRKSHMNYQTGEMTLRQLNMNSLISLNPNH